MRAPAPSQAAGRRCALLAAVLTATLLIVAAPALAGSEEPPEGGEFPSELQPGEEPQEQFGEPADPAAEQVARLLRNVLGAAVAVVIALLVIGVPLWGRRRRARDDRPAGSGPGRSGPGGPGPGGPGPGGSGPG